MCTRYFLCPLAGILLALHAKAASADQGANLVRVGCSPELGLFEFETFVVFDVHTVPDASKGIYLLRDFVQQTISCPVGSNTLSLVVTSYRDVRNRGELGQTDGTYMSSQIN